MDRAYCRTYSSVPNLYAASFFTFHIVFKVFSELSFTVELAKALCHTVENTLQKRKKINMQRIFITRDLRMLYPLKPVAARENLMRLSLSNKLQIRSKNILTIQ